MGKSTVAANLALALSNRGLKVGLLDADVYGPSLPYLIRARSSAVRRSTANAKHVLPLEAAHGTNTESPLKMLSFGHVNPKSGAPGSVSRLVTCEECEVNPPTPLTTGRQVSGSGAGADRVQDRNAAAAVDGVG